MENLIIRSGWRDKKRCGLEQKEPGNPRGEKVINPDMMQEFVLNQPKVKKAFQDVKEGENKKKKESQRPHNKENRRMKRIGVFSGHHLPQHSLPAQRHSDPEIPRVEFRQESRRRRRARNGAVWLAAGGEASRRVDLEDGNIRGSSHGEI